MAPPTEKPAWLDQAPTWLNPPPPAPAPSAIPAPDLQPVQPAWAGPQPRSSRLWIYLTGLVLVVAIGAGAVFVRGQILANQANAAQQYVASSPTPLLSDSERAGRFMNVQLTPAFAALVTPLQAVEKDCAVKSMTPACKPDLIATDKALIAGETMFEQSDIPGCIARQVNQLKYDWQGMEQGVGLAISGYANNSYDLYLQGMVRFAELAQYIQPDVDRITAAQKTCATTVQ